MELTLAILKPHVVKSSYALEAIHRLIKESSFMVVKSCKGQLTNQQVELFYKEHQNKFFYNRLISSMTSGACEVLVLAKVNAIADWRRLLGPTKVYRAVYSHPDSVRGLYGLSDTRNAAHGSDSVSSAEKEISVFFPGFNMTQWLRENEQGVKKCNDS